MTGLFEECWNNISNRLSNQKHEREFIGRITWLMAAAHGQTSSHIYFKLIISEPYT